VKESYAFSPSLKPRSIDTMMQDSIRYSPIQSEKINSSNRRNKRLVSMEVLLISVVEEWSRPRILAYGRFHASPTPSVGLEHGRIIIVRMGINPSIHRMNNAGFIFNLLPLEERVFTST
jgi:hypothetical protein